MDIRQELKLPDISMVPYYAEFWKNASKDLPNLTGYLAAIYAGKNKVGSDGMAYFHDGMAQVFAYFEGCLRYMESESSPTGSKES